MITQLLTSVGAFFSAVVRGFLLPGEFLLSAIEWVSPHTAEILTFGTGAAVITFVLALVGWTIILVVGLLVSRACRALGWQIASKFRVLVWNVKMGLGSLKTRLLWKYREYFPPKDASDESVSQGQFDDLDIAVLASLSRSGSGAAASAVELAQKYRLQPAQLEDRLVRLAKDQLLIPARGSGKGAAGYQLTDAGLALIDVCKRQASARANVASLTS